MIILDCEQGTEEWFKARAGIPTASCFDKILSSTCKPSTQANSYRYKLLAEWMTGPQETMTNEWMERGKELEEDAREVYQFIKGDDVDQVGLIYKDDKKLVSCSPDGLVGGKGLEIKCPAPHTHVEYLLKGAMPAKYIPQVQGSMYVSGLDQWDFMSYCPGMPTLILTIERDEKYHNALDECLLKFIDKLLTDREKLNNIR